jgi:hypothetical protein
MQRILYEEEKKELTELTVNWMKGVIWTNLNSLGGELFGLKNSRGNLN